MNPRPIPLRLPRPALFLLLLLAPLVACGGGEEAAPPPPADGPAPGYLLITPLKDEAAYLLDSEGGVVHSWESEHQPGNSAYLLADKDTDRLESKEDSEYGGRAQGWARAEDLDTRSLVSSPCAPTFTLRTLAFGSQSPASRPGSPSPHPLKVQESRR